MGVKKYGLFVCFVYLFVNLVDCSDILCEAEFCRTYTNEVGCSTPAQECEINNATHSGMWMHSPTQCNCCEFCLPFYGEDEDCSLGGPGTGSTVGRCADGLTCQPDDDGYSYCKRMESECHKAQDEYDARHEKGQVGALEKRPNCDGKGKYGVFECVPTQTCFCQSEEGDRTFGEVLNLGAVTEQNMHCGCSRLHAKIQKNIRPGVAYPVIGPRCTSDGNFNPVQCINKDCYCVNPITGIINSNITVNLDEKNITRLPCYDRELDLFPNLWIGSPPYNYTTPCYEQMQERIDFLLQSKEDGYITDFYSSVPDCLPDGTFGRIATNRNGSRICVDQSGKQIGDYEVPPNTQLYEDMNCKCAETSLLMESSIERPICCKNGNFRTIQCRRGLCRCVDSDGRQHGQESEDVSKLPCFNMFKPIWQDLESPDCYASW
ncbi:thyroglobulin type-1 repeat domain-containing protein [Phthorimaea operculella]|nr:thyroglobulin type-1 repeat domain-containing protein [Phthorimaea operculella]